MRKVLAQLRGYAQGEAEVNAREGRISAPKSNKEIVSRLGRRAANLILRRRLLRPHEIICRVVADYYQLAATRRWWESPGATVNRRSTSEFVVPQSAPLIGGLAFTAQRASSGWYASNGVEQHSLAAVELLFRANGLFIDCGANIGVFSVAALVVGGSDARAISFEPDSRTQQILAANLDRHAVDHRVQVRPEALGSVSGSRWFYECENDTVSGFAVAPEQFSPGRHVAVQVPATRLDDAVDLTADFIKIDVEGFEAEVLSGAELLIRNGVPDLIFLVEANPASLEVAGCSISDVIEYFPENDWAIWLIDDHAKDRTMAIRRIDRARLEVFHEADPKWYGNLLVTRSSRVDRVVGLLVSAGYVNA
jgi:FkbM family methyltransferase